MSKQFFVLTALILSAGSALADEPKEGWYIGVGGGTAQIEDKIFRDVQGATSIDDKDVNYQIWGGNRLSKHIAMQVRYISLGEYTATADNVAGVGNSKIENVAATAEMRLIWPFGESGFDVYGQLGLGVARWNADLPAQPDNPPASLSGNEPVVTYGAGVRWTFIPQLTASIGVDMHQYQGKGTRQDTAVGGDELFSFRANILTTNIGLQYKFLVT